MKKNNILITILASLLIAFAQLMFKISMAHKTIYESILSPYLYLGLILYGIATFFFIISLRNEYLSKTYPIVSLSLVWVYLISYFILGETIKILNIMGFLLVVGGISLILYKK